jgi:hypothetical protein
MNTNHTTTWKITKFILIALGLAVFSAACSVLGVLIARIFTTGTLADLGLAIIGLLFGYIFGVVLGILAIRFIFRQNGSLIFGMLAAIIWTGVSILIAVPFNLSSNLVSTIVIISFFCVPFAALGGFYWRRGKISS